MTYSVKITKSLYGIPDIRQLRELTTSSLEKETKYYMLTISKNMIESASEGKRSYFFDVTGMNYELVNYIKECLRDAGYDVRNASVLGPAIVISW